LYRRVTAALATAMVGTVTILDGGVAAADAGSTTAGASRPEGRQLATADVDAIRDPNRTIVVSVPPTIANALDRMTRQPAGQTTTDQTDPTAPEPRQGPPLSQLFSDARTTSQLPRTSDNVNNIVTAATLPVSIASAGIRVATVPLDAVTATVGTITTVGKVLKWLPGGGKKKHRRR
jgi:hypothetical protein